MTKLIVKLKIALAVLGIISMSVDIVVNLKGILTLKTTLFGWKSMILSPDLTLLNINISKKSTLRDFSC